MLRPQFLATTLFLTLVIAPREGRAESVLLPNNRSLKQVDFERHVMGLFGRTGCNLGSCHGSFQGKGGFRLSLFGYDPQKDHVALTREALGRRINLSDPDESLLLLKAAGRVDHGGGRRFGRDSWQYQVLRAWVAAGAPWNTGSGDLRTLKISPPEVVFTQPGQARQLTVEAHFSDGTVEDVAAFCDFRTNDDAVADVSNLGHVRGLRSGDTAIVVSYRGTVVPVRVLVPYPQRSGQTYPEIAAVNFVDQAVLAKLRRLNIVPADLATDAEFLRRVTIDTLGSLPTPDEVRAFLRNPDPDKRAKKIDELLAHPLHAALWATKFSDITGNNTDLLENPQPLKAKRSQLWHDWFRKRIAENRPYDEIVRGVLCATSREGKTPEAWIEEVRALDSALEKGFETSYANRATLDLFWRRQQAVTVDQWAEKTAAAFMGVRLECAQCHKHPFDRWTQVDYRAFANVFTVVVFGQSPEARKAIEAENTARRGQNAKPNNNQINQVREVFLSGGGGGRAQAALPHPDTGRPLTPKCPGGPEVNMTAGKDPREQVFEWLRAPENPFFAPSFVNRVWGHYFGVGIVHPVDDFALGNPPSNPALLESLAKEFREHKYDIRHIERTILLSRTYQLSSDTNESNRLDKINYSHSYIRPMMAEVVVDVLNSALGVTEDFGKDVARTNVRAVEVGSSRVLNPNLSYAFRIFGRPARSTACDCERAAEPALPQKLFFMVDEAVQRKLRGSGSRLDKLLASQVPNERILEELFLATLSRFPTEREKSLFQDHLTQGMDRSKVFTDTLWALINTREFVLNH